MILRDSQNDESGGGGGEGKKQKRESLNLWLFWLIELFWVATKVLKDCKLSKEW